MKVPVTKLTDWKRIESEFNKSSHQDAIWRKPVDDDGDVRVAVVQKNAGDVWQLVLCKGLQIEFCKASEVEVIILGSEALFLQDALLEVVALGAHGDGEAETGDYVVRVQFVGSADIDVRGLSKEHAASIMQLAFYMGEFQLNAVTNAASGGSDGFGWKVVESGLHVEVAKTKAYERLVSDLPW